MNNSELENIYSNVLGKVLNYLSFGLRTEKEISQRLNVYLRKLNISEQDKVKISDLVLNRLKDLGTFDDTKVLSELVLKVNSSSKPKNKRKITTSLLKRGLKFDDVSTLLAALPADYEYSCALEDFRKKSRFATEPLKIKKYLLNKGYSFEVVSRVLQDSIIES